MLKLDENLRKFRLKRELTQEQFANILGVSAQAVSRWENGTTYPDITLLPTIASYFEVTLDELMGMEDFKNQEQLKELRAQLNENGSKGLLYENILLLRDAIKNYPTDYELQLEFISYIRFCQCKNGRALSEEEQISLNREGVEIGNRILSRCTDGKIINRTTQQLCYIYFNLGEKDKAIEYAIMQDELPQKSQHTSLLVNKIEWDASNVIKSCDWSWCKILYDKMLLDRYDAIRNNARFIAVFGKIEKYC